MSPFIPSIKRKTRVLALAGITLAAIAVSVPVLADDTSALAARLANLRGEVEQLASQLNAKSTEQRETLRSMSRQRADLELEVTRGETRVQKLLSEIAKRRTEIAEKKAKGDRLAPLVDESMTGLRNYVETSLPFRKPERLASLDKIQEQYKTGLLTPSRALQRLWSFVEDEFRLTKESGLYKQTIRVDDEERLAEVIRVGMVMLFYKTEDGKVGKVRGKDGKFDYVSIDDPTQQKLVLELFTSFKKQIRVGYFELPNGLVDAEIREASAPPIPPKAPVETGEVAPAETSAPTSATGTLPDGTPGTKAKPAAAGSDVGGSEQ